MVDAIKPTHPSIPDSSTIRREQQGPKSVEPHNDEKQSKKPPPKRPLKERRNNADRRNRRNSASRQIYELRSGKDRRKSDPGHPFIEIDV